MGTNALSGIMLSGCGGGSTALGVESFLLRNQVSEAYLAHAPEINQTVIDRSREVANIDSVGISVLLVSLGIALMAGGYYLLRNR